MSSSINFRSLVEKWQAENPAAASQHWSGTFHEYLELVKTDPKVTVTFETVLAVPLT